MSPDIKNTEPNTEPRIEFADFKIGRFGSYCPPDYPENPYPGEHTILLSNRLRDRKKFAEESLIEIFAITHEKVMGSEVEQLMVRYFEILTDVYGPDVMEASRQAVERHERVHMKQNIQGIGGWDFGTTVKEISEDQSRERNLRIIMFSLKSSEYFAMVEAQALASEYVTDISGKGNFGYINLLAIGNLLSKLSDSEYDNFYRSLFIPKKEGRVQDFGYDLATVILVSRDVAVLEKIFFKMDKEEVRKFLLSKIAEVFENPQEFADFVASFEFIELIDLRLKALFNHLKGDKDQPKEDIKNDPR